MRAWGDERQILLPGDPLQGGPRVVGGRRVLSGQFGQRHHDLLILVLGHHGKYCYARRTWAGSSASTFTAKSRYAWQPGICFRHLVTSVAARET